MKAKLAWSLERGPKVDRLARIPASITIPTEGRGSYGREIAI